MCFTGEDLVNLEMSKNTIQVPILEKRSKYQYWKTIKVPKIKNVNTIHFPMVKNWNTIHLHINLIPMGVRHLLGGKAQPLGQTQ